MTERNDYHAFPVTAGNNVFATGMTLRDWFAGQIVVKLLPEMETFAEANDEQIKRAIKAVAGASYSIADAMLEARK